MPSILLIKGFDFLSLLRMFQRAFANNMKVALRYGNLTFEALLFCFLCSVFVSLLRCTGSHQPQVHVRASGVDGSGAQRCHRIQVLSVPQPLSK